jgi:hypothetical protein
VFGDRYLRGLNAEDTAKLIEVGASRGFLGCLGASTACAGNGRIARLVGMDST